MAAITIISGCLGTGKTLLSQALAHAEPAGLHFVTDTFYAFPAHALDPTTEAAHGQNATIMTAIGRAAAAFSEGGYTVFLDGVVGPWFLPTLIRAWEAVDRIEYVVLRATLEEELRRVLQRDGPLTSHRVRHMHDAFADLEEYETHVIETTQRTPDEVRAEFIQRRQRQEFGLDARSRVG